MLTPPPLGLYIHLPWCVRKCPYCDFNSHALQGDLPAEEYVDALILDLQNDLSMVWGRTVSSIYFGGGTPSLFSADQIDRILCDVRSLLPLSPDVEVTLEANPGTIEYDSFSAYGEAGINRVSLGAQSFNNNSLKSLGRIHDSQEIQNAVESLRQSNISNFNIDLMYGLPGQSVPMALDDLECALRCEPTHVSHYQLTLEPNTLFAANPPQLPDDEIRWEIQALSADRLTSANFTNYEISAWCKREKNSRHNLNYWRFGDYLGIGAGAHAKITMGADQQIIRLTKQRHPNRYLAARKDNQWRMEERIVGRDSLVFEYFLNHLRLAEPISTRHFESVTGLAAECLELPLKTAEEKGLLRVEGEKILQTELGRRFNNDLQAIFLV